VHLRYPLRHRERWRSTNLLERSLGEVRRRTKVMGRFPGETSCLSLVWAVLDLFFSHASNGATFTEIDRQHLYRIKYRQADSKHHRRGGASRLKSTREPKPAANYSGKWTPPIQMEMLVGEQKQDRVALLADPPVGEAESARFRAAESAGSA
jgi:hypothetical protein